jgi:hypothetical protein
MLFKKELTEYNRYQAFAIHMAISLVIFLILLVCITQYWYPGILFDTGNGWKAIGLIIGIDLILGPLLTLIVFNPTKSSIKFDLAVIALVQSAALIYGSWTIHQTRPVALVYMNNKFITYYHASTIGKEIEKLSKENDHLLFYTTSDYKSSSKLNRDQFTPYSKELDKVISSLSESINTEVNTLIPLDPQQIEDRYIEIDSKSAKIISLQHLPQLKIPTK